MEASDVAGSGEDQREDDGRDQNGLTEDQRRQAEESGTQGEQGEVPSGDAIPAAGAKFDPNAPVRNAPPTPGEVSAAAQAGRTAAPDAVGNRPSPDEIKSELGGQSSDD